VSALSASRRMIAVTSRDLRERSIVAGKVGIDKLKARTGGCRTAVISILDDRGASLGVSAGEIVAHLPELLGRIADPVLDLAGDPQRLGRAVGRDDVPGTVGRDQVAGFQVGLGTVLEGRPGRDVSSVHRQLYVEGEWKLVVRASVKLAPSGFLILASPLFEEESHIVSSTNFVKVVNPFRVHRPRPWA